VRATLRRYYGISLDDVLLGAVSVDECWDLLMHAPRDSPVISAIADDPLYAKDVRSAPPKLAQFSPERETLANIDDKLGSLIAVVVKGLGGKPPKIPPHPRPVTASARAEKAEARREHQDLVRQLLPGMSDPTVPQR
jgi:hypothetical protein